MPTSTIISFLGAEGSFSHQACRAFAPEFTPIGETTFRDVLSAVNEGRAACAMIPLENSRAGRVNDVYHLIPGSSIFIQSEHFLSVQHMLLAQKGATLGDIKTISSHPMALAQCRHFLDGLNVEQVAAPDTATAARDVAALKDKKRASIGSRFAAEIFDLQVLAEDIQDTSGNTTRFIVLGKTPPPEVRGEGAFITTIIFETRSIPSALFKALGGFATNGVNLTKIESYFVGDNFDVVKFYCDFEGHPADEHVRLALEEVRFYSKEVTILGAYPAAAFRTESRR